MTRTWEVAEQVGKVATGDCLHRIVVSGVELAVVQSLIEEVQFELPDDRLPLGA